MGEKSLQPETTPMAPSSTASASTVVRLRELGEMIREKRQAEQLTLGQASQQSGVSAATLSRLERQQIKGNTGAQGYHEPDMRTLAAITRWLGVGINRVADVETSPPAHHIPHRENETTPDIVRAHLRADPNLSDAAADALAQMFRLTYEQFSALKAAPKGKKERPMTTTQPNEPHRTLPATLARRRASVIEEHAAVIRQHAEIGPTDKLDPRALAAKKGIIIIDPTSVRDMSPEDRAVVANLDARQWSGGAVTTADGRHVIVLQPNQTGERINWFRGNTSAKRRN